MVVTCDYCGSSVALSGAGWKAIKVHSMLMPKTFDQNDALAITRKWMDQGLFHHHAFEDSQLTDTKLSFVPYWIVPASAVTHYQYQDMAVQGAEIGGGIAAAALLGGAMSRRGGFVAAPVFIGGGGGAKRAAELTGQYSYPVIAVQGLQSYQPKDYQFDMLSRIPFDKRKMPAGYPVMNGDVGEDAAQAMAKNFIVAVQADRAHKTHHAVESLNTDVNVQEPELLHAPVWSFTLKRKSGSTVVLVDGNKMQVMTAALNKQQ